MKKRKDRPRKDVPAVGPEPKLQRAYGVSNAEKVSSPKRGVKRG
jgi:hypothetical protein